MQRVLIVPAIVLIANGALMMLISSAIAAQSPTYAQHASFEGSGTWTIEDTPNPGAGGNELEAVALDPDGGVWAVGSYYSTVGSPPQAFIVHRAFGVWDYYTPMPVGGSRLWGVTAIASNNVWA